MKKKHQRDFDKPSSSVFLPPEYVVGNCEPMLCYMENVDLFGPYQTPLNVDTLFTTDARYTEEVCFPTYHYYVDGTKMTSFWGSSSGSFVHAFPQSGWHTVEVEASCAYCPLIRQRDSVQVYVPAPPPPQSVSINTAAQTYFINNQIQMPAITFEATASPSNLPLSGLTFHWRMTINHSQGGRTTTQVSIPSSGTIDIKGNNKWTRTGVM